MENRSNKETERLNNRQTGRTDHTIRGGPNPRRGKEKIDGGARHGEETRRRTLIWRDGGTEQKASDKVKTFGVRSEDL
jgi:hypothetical protein